MKLTELLNQLNLGNFSILIFLVLSLVEIWKRWAAAAVEI